MVKHFTFVGDFRETGIVWECYNALWLRTHPDNLNWIIPAEETTMKTPKYLLGIALGLLATGTINQSLLAQDTVRSLDEVLIRDTRVSNKAPLTTTTINKDALFDQKTEISIPYIIELQPSVVATTENCAAGNTTLRIRGIDASRINVNINGITLNDPESHAVYWVDIPNLGGMAQSLQIQRGVGASTGGAASFGAAINLQTLNAQSNPYGYADIAYGSWNTRQYGIGAGTGITKSGLSFDMNYTGLTTDGFIRNGFSDQQSLFLNGSYYGERTLVKAIAIVGKQRTGITWNGASADELDADATYNNAGLYLDDQGNIRYYDNETDNYLQQRYQLYVNHMLSDAWSVNAAFDFTHGKGYDENYRYNKKASKYGLLIGGVGTTKSDFITDKEMRNNAYTFNLGTRYEKDKLNISFGESFLLFDGAHFGTVRWSKDPSLASLQTTHHDWYSYDGAKKDATTFVKVNYELSSKVNFYGDLQYRFVRYGLDGMDDDFNNLDFCEDYHFFNPKAGINLRFADNQRTYFVAGISHREPTRSDIKDKIASGDTIKAEAMLDIELGYQIQKQRFSISANLYAMLYKDQLTPSGDLSDAGYALMENVDKSYRLGIEMEAGYRFTKSFKMDANLTLSQNKIIDYKYTEFEDGVSTTLTEVTKTTDLSFSPSVVGAAIATFEPTKKWRLQIIGKYVGEMYGDNTSRVTYKQDAYFLLNFKTSYTWDLGGNKALEAQFIVRNLLNKKYRVIAWVGDWQDDTTNIYYNSAAYMQQPGINYTARLSFRF